MMTKRCLTWPRTSRKTGRAFLLMRVLTALTVTILANSLSAQYRPPVLDPNMRASDQKLKIQKEIGIDQKLNSQVPLDLTFRDETGKEVQLKDYLGDTPVILSLVYYGCPMLCNQVLNGMVTSLKFTPAEPGKEYKVLTVSFDPTEKPELAAEKRENYLRQIKKPGIEDAWHFLTGEQDQITKLAEAVGFRYTYDNDLKQYAHASGIMILTPEGRVARYFYGIVYMPNDMRLGIVEASAGKIGNLVDQVLLMCYHYDPALGKYGLLTLNLIRIGGIITLLAVGTFMFVMIRRDIRQNRLAETKQAG